MQSYGDFKLIPRNCTKSSLTCVDKRLDNGQIGETGPKVVYYVFIFEEIWWRADKRPYQFCSICSRAQGLRSWLLFKVIKKRLAAASLKGTNNQLIINLLFLWSCIDTAVRVDVC